MILGKYFNHISLTTDGDNGAGVATNVKYAAIPFDNPGIVIECVPDALKLSTENL